LKYLKHILFYTILLLLAWLAVYSFVQKEEIFPLNGAVKTVEKPTFNWKDLLSGDFQKNMDARTQNKFCYRSLLIRLRNQLDYSLFDEIHARNVVEGKEQYLYEQNYIDAYLGKDFIGENRIEKKVKQIKFLQDTLATMDKTLLVTLAAGKASFYPEYLPSEYDDYKKTLNNYEYYAEQLAVQNVNHIDFNSLFLAMKDTSQYLLYPKMGIHWSCYGEWFVADSIINYLENKMQKDLPDLVCERLDFYSPPVGRDKDLVDGMNLLLSMDKTEMAYPKIRFDKEGKFQPKATVVADSYYWGLENIGFGKDVFTDSDFRFYNNEIYNSNGDYKKAAHIDALTEAMEKDVILLMVTEGTISGFPWSYIQDLYDSIRNPTYDKIKVERQIRNIMKDIKNDKKWYDYLVQEAKKNQQSIDTVLYLNAKFFYEQNYK